MVAASADCRYCPACLVQFTGHIARTRHIVLINNRSVAVTHGGFEFLLVLAVALLNRVSTHTGLGRSRPPKDPAEKDALHHLVNRLRADIDQATGSPQFGTRLIRHAGHSTYLLAIPAKNILVDAELIELEPIFPHLIPRLLAARTAIASATIADLR